MDEPAMKDHSVRREAEMFTVKPEQAKSLLISMSITELEKSAVCTCRRTKL